MPKIFVIILNFNGGQNTVDCLLSFSNISKKEFEFEKVVVDNGSKDGSIEQIRKKFNDVIIIENQKNLGFAGGNNEGIRFALKSGADFVMLLNNDTIVHSGLVKNLLEPLEHDSVGGVVPKIYFEKGYEFHKDRYKESDKGKVIWYAGGKMDWENLIGENIGVDEVDHGQFDIRMETDLATGCCFMVRSDVLKNVGMFDDRYFLYYEDADLSQRIKKAGHKIIYEPAAIVWHKNAESSGGSGSDLQDYYITRNRLLFGMTYAPLRTKASLIRESLKLIRTGRKWQKKGVKDFYLRLFNRGTFPI
ncbi:MAG: hypothetical protein A3G66_01350 [Candidatus Levybacteria bacterium RIFCSPLOWO2_12_FULL_39_17]|nr:MAG: Glycosyl transferase family 2 [Candidatus Levybacteria bacterium GW2011_GWA1_39_11]OGH15335.1 MAG: hypothetical protein A2689_02225 [Candidatus Levybacteria bacterium RIFCSPHIGHO2_01_FULL_38_96]OGH36367.1 MAG: hypothetical protein A3B43_02905 [Candidatus Levybacteria bacterium RIFCSPLOWO2_01_FULL_38_120]OGH47099.1 MAG: hypothetical protein A3G66_01350 [Candidatus Levybacteria bacterium RIFCSPLOWO2_12_FULL_39_17]